MPDEKLNEMNECWKCKYRRSIPNNAHIKCIHPDEEMEGSPHGIKQGWFNYPFCFDPTWKLKKCANFKKED